MPSTHPSLELLLRKSSAVCPPPNLFNAGSLPLVWEPDEAYRRGLPSQPAVATPRLAHRELTTTAPSTDVAPPVSTQPQVAATPAADDDPTEVDATAEEGALPEVPPEVTTVPHIGKRPGDFFFFFGIPTTGCVGDVSSITRSHMALFSIGVERNDAAPTEPLATTDASADGLR